MTLEEMKDKAVAKVTADNPNGTGFKVAKTYENLMDGTLITISFVPSAGGKEDSNHVHFGKDDIRTYRWLSDALSAVASYKEWSPFFRLLELIGIGGLIALILVLIFSVLLGVLAFTNSTQNPVNTSIVDVIKLSFTLILGYFFGKARRNNEIVNCILVPESFLLPLPHFNPKLRGPWKPTLQGATRVVQRSIYLKQTGRLPQFW